MLSRIAEFPKLKATCTHVAKPGCSAEQGDEWRSLSCAHAYMYNLRHARELLRHRGQFVRFSLCSTRQDISKPSVCDAHELFRHGKVGPGCRLSICKQWLSNMCLVQDAVKLCRMFVGQMHLHLTGNGEKGMCCGGLLYTCQGGCNRVISALAGWQGAQLHGCAGCWAAGGATPAQVIRAGDHPHRHGPIPPKVLRQGVCQLLCPAKPLERPCWVQPTLHCLLSAFLPVLNCLCRTRVSCTQQGLIILYE